MRVLMRIIISTDFWGQGGTPCEIPSGSARCSIELQYVFTICVKHIGLRAGESVYYIRQDFCSRGSFLTYRGYIGGVHHEKANYDIGAQWDEG